MAKQWFHDWFNSPYYHILYSNRNQTEAENFIDELCNYLKPSPNIFALDVACGRGRHATYLSKKGLDVTGIDLSVCSIQYARKFETKSLRFFVHDMRGLYYKAKFDLVFNLFTSFGYFNTEQQHVNALLCMNRSLKKDGLIIMDYFNVHKVLPAIIPYTVKTVDGIIFHIHKKVTNKNIIKTINFEDKSKAFEFKEIVKAFTLADFELLFKNSGFKLMKCFGNYCLEEFDSSASDRLIMICKKANA